MRVSNFLAFFILGLTIPLSTPPPKKTVSYKRGMINLTITYIAIPQTIRLICEEHQYRITVIKEKLHKKSTV